MRIVLIEPDARLAKLYADHLQTAGNTVVKVATAQVAIHMIDVQKPDLVILELQLVSHSGVEFLYELRSYPEWQNIPVIIHTVVPQATFQRYKQQLAALGVTDYLYKPLTRLATLQLAIERQSTIRAV
jgi:DNA-binding response OmpR family regulator